jgi:CDP-glycerol glycerophosphotransferase
MFDFLNTGKKIILYTYDYDDYLKQRGLYYDLNDLPFARANTESELLSEIRSSASFDYSSVRLQFTTYDKPCAATTLLKFVLEGKDARLVVKEPQRSSKESSLLYVGNLNLNGITSSVLNLLSVIDDSSEDIFYCVKQSHFEKQPDKILVLPENARIVPLFDKVRPSFLEGLALVASYKFNIETKTTISLLGRMFERESYRLLGSLRLNKAIQYTGYDVGVMGVFEKLEAKRAIFAHNDMIKEYQTRKNINLKMLRHFYNNFDRVACVSQAAYDSVVKIGDRKDNIRIVQNAIDGKTIRRKALEKPQFDEGTSSNCDLETVVDILDRDCTKFINIARFSAEKGQRRLIDAFNEFYRSNQNSYLIIIGGLGELYESLSAYAASLEAGNNIILIKELKNPYPFLKKSSCFAFSSFYEGLGVVLLEAAVLGVPMFSTDIQGPRELLRLHEGILVEDSELGILEGMKKYASGEIVKLDFDYASYNEKVSQEFDDLFK